MNQSNMIVNLPITNFLAKKLSVFADGTVFVYGILQQDITGLLKIAYDKFGIDGFIGQRSGENVINLRIKEIFHYQKHKPLSKYYIIATYSTYRFRTLICTRSNPDAGHCILNHPLFSLPVPHDYFYP